MILIKRSLVFYIYIYKYKYTRAPSVVTRRGSVGEKWESWSQKKKVEVEGVIISALYVFSASRPPLANRTSGHLN